MFWCVSQNSGVCRGPHPKARSGTQNLFAMTPWLAQMLVITTCVNTTSLVEPEDHVIMCSEQATSSPPQFGWELKNYLALCCGGRCLFTEADSGDPLGTSLQRVPLPEQDVPPGAAWKPEVDRKEGNPGASRHNNTVLIRPPHTHKHVNAPQPGDVLVEMHPQMY